MTNLMSHDGMSQGQERAFLDNYHQKSAHLITEKCKVSTKLQKNSKKTVKMKKIVREASAKPQFSRSSKFRGQLCKEGASK